MENGHAIALREKQEIVPLSGKDLHDRVQIIQRVIQAVMKKNVHYGQVFGGGDKSLWKPGAEVLRLTFHCDVKQEVEELRDGRDVGFRVKSFLYNPLDGSTVEVFAECWTNEEKFAWREAICAEEFEATDADLKRTKWKKTNGGDIVTINQIRTNPADQRNAVLQRAGKRSFVQVILRGTGASDCFSQELEEDDAIETTAKTVTTGTKTNGTAKPGMNLDGTLKSAKAATEEPRRPGQVVVEYGGKSLELGFWKTPADLALEKDWTKLTGYPCRFAYEEKESKGKVYKNLSFFQFLPKPDAQPEMFGDEAERMANEERAAMQAGA